MRLDRYRNRKVYLTTHFFEKCGAEYHAVGEVIEIDQEEEACLIRFPASDGAEYVEILASPNEFLLYEMYKRVRLTTDRHALEGVGKGAMGYVIEIHDEKELYLLEFSREDGSSYATIAATRNDFVLDE